MQVQEDQKRAETVGASMKGLPPRLRIAGAEHGKQRLPSHPCGAQGTRTGQASVLGGEE